MIRLDLKMARILLLQLHLLPMTVLKLLIIVIHLPMIVLMVLLIVIHRPLLPLVSPLPLVEFRTSLVLVLRPSPLRKIYRLRLVIHLVFRLRCLLDPLPPVHAGFPYRSIRVKGSPPRGIALYIFPNNHFQNSSMEL